MQFLTVGEASTWASRYGYSTDRDEPTLEGGSSATRFLIPEDAGKRVVLARVLWEAAGAGVPETLLWFTDWSVWPSGEHVPLAEAARRGFGASSSVAQTPAQVARLGEDDAALGILCLAALFLWDCWVLPGQRGRPAVFLSHDEYGVVFDRGDDQGLATRLAALELVKPLPQAI